MTSACLPLTAVDVNTLDHRGRSLGQALGHRGPGLGKALKRCRRSLGHDSSALDATPATISVTVDVASAGTSAAVDAAQRNRDGRPPPSRTRQPRPPKTTPPSLGRGGCRPLVPRRRPPSPIPGTKPPPLPTPSGARSSPPHAPSRSTKQQGCACHQENCACHQWHACRHAQMPACAFLLTCRRARFCLPSHRYHSTFAHAPPFDL